MMSMLIQTTRVKTTNFYLSMQTIMEIIITEFTEQVCGFSQILN